MSDDDEIFSDGESDDESVSEIVTCDNSSDDDSLDGYVEDESSEPPDFDEDGEAFSDCDDESDARDKDSLSNSNTRATLSTGQEWRAAAPAKQE